MGIISSILTSPLRALSGAMDGALHGFAGNTDEREKFGLQRGLSGRPSAAGRLANDTLGGTNGQKLGKVIGGVAGGVGVGFVLFNAAMGLVTGGAWPIAAAVAYSILGGAMAGALIAPIGKIVGGIVGAFAGAAVGSVVGAFNATFKRGFFASPKKIPEPDAMPPSPIQSGTRVEFYDPPRPPTTPRGMVGSGVNAGQSRW